MILNISTEKYYIGRAFCLDMRWRTHKSALNKNKHANEYLQNAWNFYGESDFKFFIIELVFDKSKIIACEQYWIDYLQACNREKGFNLNPSAANSLGYKHSEEVKEKIRANSIRLGLKPPDPTGRKHSEASKLKMSISNSKPKSNTWNMKGRPDLRNKERWPHKDGCKCRCDECRLKKNAQDLKSLQKRKPPKYFSYPEFEHLK